MMRKTVLVLAMMMAGGSCGAMASADVGTWYTGLKAGWSDYYNEDLGHHVSQNSNASTQLGVKGDNGAGGVFLGYQATDWLALEGGYDYLGNMRVSSNNSSGANMENQGIQLAVKLGLPVTDRWGLYTRMGMMGWHARTKNAGHAMNDEGISPLAALGTELSLGEDWSLRLEYQYVANIGEGGDTGITVDNGQTSLGVIYHFGQSALPNLPSATPAPSPAPASRTFNLRSDVLFAHDSATLMPAGHDAIVQLYQGLHPKNSKNLHITVKGYTDRMGTTEYNQALSARRAQSVADVLAERGIPATAITVQGEGSDAPVTGNTCDSMKNRDALITCLAPDRRVVVDVVGEKAEVTASDPSQYSPEMHF